MCIHDNYASRKRSNSVSRLAALLVAMLVLTACGGGGGGGAGDTDTTDAPSGPGGANVSASDLAGTWGGTLESTDYSFSSVSLDIDTSGDITAVRINGQPLSGVTGTLQSTDTGSGQLFVYDLAGDILGFYADASAEHAGLLLEDGSVGVVQKDPPSSPGTFSNDAAAGSWAGSAVYIGAGFEADSFSDVQASFQEGAGTVSGEDLTIVDRDTGNECRDMNAALGAIDTTHGIYDAGTITGGQGTTADDCPGGQSLPADAYMSYDGQFMVLYAGCEAISVPEDCSLAVLSRSGSGDGSTGDSGSDGSGSTDASLSPSADGAPFQVNTTTTLQQLGPALAIQSDGGFVVVWEDFLKGVIARRYDATGTSVTGEIVVSGDAANPAATALDDGGMVAVYGGEDASGAIDGVLAQRFDTDINPTGTEILVNTQTSAAQDRPSVAALAGGGFVVVWQSMDQDGDGWGVYAQRYDALGAAVGGEFRVSTETANDQYWPDVAGLTGGGFVVAWQSILQDGASAGIYAQRYDASGNPVGGERLVNNEELQLSPGSFTPDISALPDGGFLVSWDTGYRKIFARRFDAAGAAVAEQFQVNTTESINALRPASSALADGGFVVVWRAIQDEQWTVLGQRYTADGNPVGNEFDVPEALDDFGDYDSRPAIKALPNGGFIVAWVGNGTEDGGIMARLFSVEGSGSGGGGSSGGDGSGTTDFSGSWNGTSTQSSNCGDDGTSSGTITITQSGTDVEVYGIKPSGSFSGTISGDTVSSDSPFSYPEDGGTTTVTSWSATMDSGGDSFSGSSSFEWSGSGLSCSGTTSFTATRG